MVCLTLAFMVVPSLAANTPGKIDYVAFGDSVSSGVRGGVGAPGSELGSDKGYTDNIAKLLQEAGVLGSFDESFCTSGMTAKLLAENTAVLCDPATDSAKLVADAEIATLDIGANDLLDPLYTYVATLTNVLEFNQDKAKEILNQMIEDLHGTKGTEIQSGIKTILQNILTANSSVKIFVMGYYNPLPVVSSQLGIDLNEHVKYLNTLIKQSITDIISANPNASITYVDTFDAMAASSAALVLTDIHPTEAGYVIIADEFWTKIEPVLDLDTDEPPVEKPLETAPATPSTMPIIVGGIQLPFGAYNVNGNNYVKLRDVAMAINGTQKQIAIDYNETTKAIDITVGQAYTPVGGELGGIEALTAATATLSTSAFTIDGKQVNLTAYNINGNNYIKLRDIGQAIDISVIYDEATNSVNVDVTKGYEA